MKVIFHIDEMAKWELLCGNVNNIFKESERAGEKIEVKVLANYEAVKALTDKKIEELLKGSIGKFKIYACQNSINLFEIDTTKLLSFVEIVPSGVYYLALQQENGFKYIKP